MKANGKVSIPENGMIPRLHRMPGKVGGKLPASPGQPAPMAKPSMDEILAMLTGVSPKAPAPNGPNLGQHWLNPGPPIAKRPMNDMDPGHAMTPGQLGPSVPPELLQLVKGRLESPTPQIPRSNSISDLLRRR